MVNALLLLILLTGCNLKNSADKTGQNGHQPQKLTPISRNSLSSSMTGPIRFVALGDSTGAGVGARDGGYVARLFKRIVRHRQGSELTNLCVSGATTSDVLRNQLDRALRADPHLVTLGIGINDIGHGLSLEQFSKNYDEILSSLNSNTKAAIVLTNIPDISTAPRIPIAIRGEYHQLIVAFNRKLEEIASRYDVSVFDVYTITHEQLALHPEFFSDDGFHPSDKGYEFWADEMWPIIALTIGAEADGGQ